MKTSLPIQRGGRIQPQSDWKLWRIASLLHFLRQDKNYTGQGKKAKTFQFKTLEAGRELIFPAKPNWEPLDTHYQKLAKLDGYSSLTKKNNKYYLLKNDSDSRYDKILTQSYLHYQIPFKNKKDIQSYLKAIADNLWGFLKHKEGDLTKEVVRQQSGNKQDQGYKAWTNTHYGHTIGTGTFARKIAELVSSLIIIQEGVPVKWVYESQSYSGGSKDYSLFLKNMLVQLLINGNQTEKQQLLKILKDTPVDSILSAIWRNRSLKKLMDRYEPPDVYYQLEKVRFLGNRSAHAGHPGDWDPKLSDAQQEELAEALSQLLEIFLTEYLSVVGWL